MEDSETDHQFFWELIGRIEPLVLTPTTHDLREWRLIFNEASGLPDKYLSMLAQTIIPYTFRCRMVQANVDKLLEECPDTSVPANQVWQAFRRHYLIGSAEA